YQKHKAEWMVRNNFLLKPAVRLLAALMPGSKGSREGAMQNKIRQLHRMADGVKLSPAERYIRWCSMMDEAEVAKLLAKPISTSVKKENNFYLPTLTENR